jgi:hypothetical protein
MPYPEQKKRQLSLDDDTATAVARPGAVPQVTPGAPRLNAVVAPSFAQAIPLESASAGQSLLKGLDFNRPLKPATGSGGPERWDKLKKDSFSGDNARFLTMAPPSPVGADTVMQQFPQAVSAMREKLEARRSQLSDAERAKSKFWQQYDAQGQAFVADLIASVQELLTRSDRFEQAKEGMQQLSPAQTEWVRNHPLGVWLDWLG